MKNYFFLILTVITISSCRSKQSDNSDTKLIEEQIELTEKEKIAPLKSENKKVDNWMHPASFRFKNYTEYRVTDTINIDLNGNGILERVYFNKKDCLKLIIEEKGKNLISIGCTKEDYNGFPNDIDWVNLWCVVSDKETYEVIVKGGELVDDKIVNLDRPSIYIGKEEAGGGIITYKNGEFYWVHQSD